MSLAQGLQIRQQRKALQQQAKIRNQELERVGYRFDENGQMSVRQNSAAEAEQLEAKEAVQLARSLQNKLAAQATDVAFEDFSHTGDASYLQKALDENPELKTAWAQRGVQMVGNVDFEQDKSLLSRGGFKESQYDTPEKKEILKRNIYKVYDGKQWNIGVANKAVAETGVAKRLGNRRGGIMKANYKDFADLMQGPKGYAHTAEGHKYEDLITSAAEKYDLPPNLIASQIQTESSGNPNAVSPVGAGGLMQIMPPTAKDLGVDDVFDPKQAIEGGAKYMRQLLDRYDGDVKLALAAYNAGMGNVDKYGGVPPFDETQNYVKKIMGNFDIAEKYYGRDAESTSDIILNHRRAKANAEAGLSNEIVDKQQTLDKRKVDQIDRQQDQKDIDLALSAEDNELKRASILAKLKTDGVTTKQKDLNKAAQSTEEMIDSFGGEDEFFSTDFSDDKNYRKAYRKLVEIERLEGTEPSEADKKAITDIRQLIALGDPATQLTSAQTGIIDSNLANMKEYFSDNVKGKSAKSSYAAFRNSVRNALFGSALTEHEIKSFDEAYGKLGKKLGPALEMFKTSLAQVQAKLDSTSNLMNPYSAKIRLGADQEKLTRIQEALQSRIDYIQGKIDGTPNQETGYTKENRQSLDDIFGANQ